jgi:hypothetical protein
MDTHVGDGIQSDIAPYPHPRLPFYRVEQSTCLDGTFNRWNTTPFQAQGRLWISAEPLANFQARPCGSRCRLDFLIHLRPGAPGHSLMQSHKGGSRRRRAPGGRAGWRRQSQPHQSKPTAGAQRGHAATDPARSRT